MYIQLRLHMSMQTPNAATAVILLCLPIGPIKSRGVIIRVLHPINPTDP